MDIEAALRELTTAIAAGDGRGGEVSRRAARRLLAGLCARAMGDGSSAGASLTALFRSAATAPAAERRDCAVLVVHALAFPGLVPTACAADVCAMAEAALHGVLLRCGYPFGGSPAAKLDVLQRLHRRIDELMQPLEPTFPNWIQGLHAG